MRKDQRQYEKKDDPTVDSFVLLGHEYTVQTFLRLLYVIIF